MAGLLDCQILVDGLAVNDGTTDHPVVALSGLRVTWGRNNSLDQPQPSTCTFTLLDATADANSLQALRVGSELVVQARGGIYGAAEFSTFDDSDLASIDAVSTTNGNSQAQATGSAALISKRVAGPSWYATFTPRALGADWSDIPQSAPGQTWQIQATLTLPFAATVSLVPLWFSGSDDPYPLMGGAVAQVAGPPYSATLAYDVTAPDDAAGYWLGFRLVVGSQVTWGALDPGITWAEAGTIPGAGSPFDAAWGPEFGAIAGVPWAAFSVSHADAITPAEGATRLVRVFSGYVTDIQAAWDSGAGALGVSATAADYSAALANRLFGAESWVEQTINARVTEILTAAALTTPVAIDSGVSGVVVVKRDVDSQSPLALLQDAATSGGGVLWTRWSVAQGHNFWIEDITQRGALRSLVESGGMVVIVADDLTTDPDALLIDSCDVLLAPLSWRQETQDVVTRVGVTWVKASGADKTEWLIDVAGEASYGVRALTVGTDLAYATDALVMANRLANRVFGLTWRLDGLAIDADEMESPDDTATELLASLLDIQTRPGRLLVVQGMPTWAPVTITGSDRAGYLEGGVYEYIDGAWLLSLVTSDVYGAGPSVPWADLEAGWAWNEFDDSITYGAMRGVSV